MAALMPETDRGMTLVDVGAGRVGIQISLGLAGDLELAFPLGLACFRTRGGSRGYCHGGISLQELVLPVASITVRESRATDVGTATVMLSVAKPKTTTRFFSVEARYVVGGLFGEDTKRVKAVVRTNRTEVGMAAMAAYDFEEGTQEVVLEEGPSQGRAFFGRTSASRHG